MKIKKSNWMLYFINLAFPMIEPKTLCSFFWLFIVTLISTPIIYLGMMSNIFINKYSRIEYGVNAITSIFTLMLTLTPYKKISDVNILYIYPLHILSIIILLGMIIIIAVIFHLVEMVFKDKKHTSIIEKQKKKYMIIEIIKAIKGKYCPIIEYVDN